MAEDEDAAPQPPIPVEEDVMALSRLGEIGAIQKLFDSGKCDARFRDEQNITPLHWAAIKGHFALCHYLIHAGADVNAKGGDVDATPVLWAARSCHYYVVNLLLENGADPMATDDQGFNLLQNATMEGNVYQLIMLLHADLSVDVPDAHGHTSLMWAAYRGFPACVEVLLIWGASVSAQDENSFTALHWALVKGSQGCVQKLLEFGSDRFAQTKDGKTPSQCAKEMNTVPIWEASLAEAGFDQNGAPTTSSFLSLIASDKRLALSRFFFFYPYAILLVCFWIVSILPVYFGLPAAALVFFGLQSLGQQLLTRSYVPNMKHMHHTPFLAGIFAGSLFWAGVVWITRILPWTWGFSARTVLANLAFALLYSLCTYFYFMTMFEDPGHIPKSSSRSEQRAVTQDLLKAGIFDERHFCTTCMARKALRSKHCRRCNRCVAKQDHHCPWVNNCVANNNHRHFVFYVITMWLGILLYGWLAYEYFLDLIDRPPASTHEQCTLIPDYLCLLISTDYFAFILTVWLLLQNVWITLLLLTQLFQIARGQTTFEVMKGHPQLSGPGPAVVAGITAGSTTMEGAQLTDNSAAGPDAVRPKKQESWWEQWKRLFGIDQFVATALHGSRADEVMRRRRENPFTRGIVQNLRDFFMDPEPVFGKRRNGTALLGGATIDYTKVYEPPWDVGITGERGTGEELRRLDIVNEDDD